MKEKKLQYYDSPAQINQCLSCSKPKCDNCHQIPVRQKRGRPKKPVICFIGDYEKIYPSVTEAAEDMHVCEAAIRSSALYGYRSCGFQWRYAEE